ncbi:hypothetical protein NQ318_006651 [Aromia moschata]|uniref:Transposase n=1 Tax=Aromia moschata TaxID=1265417 RepID=A0AAV8YQ05_9CUCU|nr:hypothetical protein NQ318_006651 [Aromia moschata]
MDLVGQYVKTNNLKTPFRDGIPGKDWLLFYMKRHKLTVKKPENVEIARRKSVDPFIINNYFDLVLEASKNLGIENKPHLVWNLDETSFCSDPSKTKVVDEIEENAKLKLSGLVLEAFTAAAAAEMSSDFRHNFRFCLLRIPRPEAETNLLHCRYSLSNTSTRCLSTASSLVRSTAAFARQTDSIIFLHLILCLAGARRSAGAAMAPELERPDLTSKWRPGSFMSILY